MPTLLSYNKLSRPMQFLYDIIGISPGYHEVDVSSVFLCFFSIFFAMIVGDMAYGLLFLAIALIVRKKKPNANSAGFHFIYLMSGMTIFWGLINASFLGLSPELASWTRYLDLTNYAWLPEPLQNAMLWIRTAAPSDPAKFAAYHSWVSGISFFPESFVPLEAGESQMQHIQFFCFCIAVVHLSIAHLWNIAVRIKRKDSTFLAQVGCCSAAGACSAWRTIWFSVCRCPGSSCRCSSWRRFSWFCSRFRPADSNRTGFRFLCLC